MTIARLPASRLRERLAWTSRAVRQSPVRLVVLCVFSVVFLHRAFSVGLAHKPWSLAPMASMERQCKRPQYETLGSSSTNDEKPRICLTTLTDEKNKALRTRLFGWRNFDGLLQLTWQNKVDYAAKHGYNLFDESDQLDKTRPPSWSKIRAVTRLLREENCTWVFWLDADAVIMNSERRIENFLPADPTKDLLLSEDTGGGYNAGVWLVHNTEWSLRFLQEWWDMKSFVKPTGLAKSGDNDALKYKLRHMADFEEHILAPPRCTFNSYVMLVPPSSLASVTAKAQDHAWYLREDVYHKNDFVAHVAGVDNKGDVLKMLLEQAS